MKTAGFSVPWFQKRDIDGFFGLGLDNLIQFILISALCQQVLGMSLDFIICGCCDPVSMDLSSAVGGAQ